MRVATRERVVVQGVWPAVIIARLCSNRQQCVGCGRWLGRFRKGKGGGDLEGEKKAE